jgi:Delta7-sterol 5-desaturase
VEWLYCHVAKSPSLNWFRLIPPVVFKIRTVPFPGPGWLDNLALKPDAALTMPDGTTYPSAYAAILYNDPLSNPCRNFNAWVNAIFFSNGVAAWFITTLNSIELAHYVLCYLRNFIGAMIVYYGTASVFHYFCYVHPMSRKIYEEQGRTRPTWETIKNQIQLSQASLTIYTMLPVLDEFLVESGYTKVYHSIEEIGGWPAHIATMLLYFACVEIGIYWMHRTLHTNKFLYKHVHLKHHQYKSAETLTPWASIAFHPLDGMLQASPYVLMLPFVPCHYLTHFGLLFFTAIWATYIHDAMDWNIDPVMGSKYHTVHHTHYIYNYGQVFIFCDWFWGTLRIPEGPTGIPSTTTKKKAA